MSNQLKQLKPIDDLKLFEFTYLYAGEFDKDRFEAVVTRVHGGYLYMHWYSGTNAFIPHIFPKNIKDKKEGFKRAEASDLGER